MEYKTVIKSRLNNSNDMRAIRFNYENIIHNTTHIKNKLF